MKKLLLILFIFNTFIIFSQNLFFGYTNKYMEMDCDRYETVYKEDSNKIYFIEDIKTVKKIEIKEYGNVFNYRKIGLWTGINDKNEIICHRFYNDGYLKYDIQYYKNKIHSFVNYSYNPEILDDWREEDDIRDTQGNYSVDNIIFYAEDGKIKSQYYYNYDGEYVEKNINTNPANPAVKSKKAVRKIK